MTPYLIGGQWIDLDHVLAITQRHFPEPLAFGYHGGSITLAFRNEALYVVVGRAEDAWMGGGWRDAAPVMSAEEAQTIWDRFIEAWKARDRHVMITPGQSLVSPSPSP